MDAGLSIFGKPRPLEGDVARIDKANIE